MPWQPASPHEAKPLTGDGQGRSARALYSAHSCPPRPGRGSGPTSSWRRSAPAAWARSGGGKDTRLDRSVAIKILPAAFAEDDERRQRFEREAKTISSLNHPHICTLFDVGHEGDAHFLVMELLEGESLADRLQKGPLPLDQVVKFGAQIAEALSAAHKQGIVHRDLKPGNVMLTKTGAKLLDFGLARPGAGLGGVSGSTDAADRGEAAHHRGDDPRHVPVHGPRAARGRGGRRADRHLRARRARSTRWRPARRAFEGKSKTSLIAAILSSQPPPISSVQPVMPPALDHVVKKCLEKDPDDRWQSAHDVASELRWIGEAGSQAGVPATLSLRRRSRERLAWALAGGLGLLWLLTLVPATLHWRERAPKSQPVRFTISPPDKTAFSASTSRPCRPTAAASSFVTAPAAGRETLWMRALDSLSAQPLAGTEGGSFPFWSPDGRAVAFFADGELKKVEVAGGTPQTLCTTQGGGGGAWNQHGEILFAGGAGPIFRVSASGGEPKPVTTLDKSRGETQHRWPSFLPDGRHFLYLARGRAARPRMRSSSRRWMAPRLEQLVSADSPAVYAPPDRLLYVREGALVSQPFDAATRSLAGEVSPVAERIAGVAAAGRAFSVSTSGVLTYRTGANLRARPARLVRPHGSEAGDAG